MGVSMGVKMGVKKIYKWLFYVGLGLFFCSFVMSRSQVRAPSQAPGKIPVNCVSAWFQGFVYFWKLLQKCYF